MNGPADTAAPAATPADADTSDDWRAELDAVNRLMRHVSRINDPQQMVQAYGEGLDRFFPTQQWLSVSRRGLERPRYRITRSSRWVEEVDPWRQRDRLPLLAGGLLERLVYGNEPVLIDDVRVDSADPAAEYFENVRCLVALPHYDDGEALNVTLMMFDAPGAFDRTKLPVMLWQANLFGRATLNMVLRRELTEAYAALDREMQSVGELQKSLLPDELPAIPTLAMAAHYQTSKRAGGDYYDFFPLPDGKWGVFLADVSGHGTASAVVMAITHAIAHCHPGPVVPPGSVLRYLNDKLTVRYARRTGSFVTAFYAVYDPATRRLTYSCAGHNPPRLARGGAVVPLDQAGSLPLGIEPDEAYGDHSVPLAAGDLLVLYTDGVTESFSRDRDMFGVDRLDALLAGLPADCEPAVCVADVLAAVDRFTDGVPATDDRTLLAIRVS